MHGPPPSWANGVRETWPSLPTIAILDTVALTLKPRRQKKWRALRLAAMTEWHKAGFTFFIVEDTEDGYYQFADVSNGVTDQELEDAMVYPYLRLMRIRQTFGGHLGFGAWMPNTNGSALAAFYVGSTFWQAVSLFFRRYVVTHEIGHCLGLNHRDPPAISVMRGDANVSTKPDDHDLLSLTDYYWPVVIA